MQWKEVVADPNLRDLPFKIETNEWGQIVMTPAKVMHGKYQLKIGMLLTQLMQEAGEATIECAIQTGKGTKVADVAWFSADRWQQVQDEYDSSIAPEICVEVISRSNSSEEIQDKKNLYFERGAVEVWTCDAKGKMQFYTQAGEIPSSVLVPHFPKTITR
ncbi:MAG: Uma2 family endonuclease [Caldilineaceae bacterium]